MTETRPLLHMFGSTKTVKELEDGTEFVTEEVHEHGKVVAHYEHHTERVKIDSEGQVIAEFVKFMEFVRADRKRFDPDFKLRTDRKSGKIYQAIKSWSEPV